MKNFYLLCLCVFISLAAWPSGCGAIVNEEMLNQAGLQTVWQKAIALNPPARKRPNEKIQKITVLGDYLYVLTDNNYLFCLDRNSGRLNLATAAAEPKLPVFEPTDYNGITYLTAADYIIAADVEKGMETSRKKIRFSIAAAAAVNAYGFYIPGTDKRLHVIDPNDMTEKFKANADNLSAITSILATDKFVIFATGGGNIMSMNPAAPKKLWQFDAVGGITAPLVMVKNQVYAAGRDTNLYKLDAANGKLLWTFHCGSVLTTPARANGTAVYQYARDKGLYAIDANSGKQLWLLPEGLDLLAQDGDTAYIFDKNNTCVVMDNKQGKKKYIINFASVTAFAANVYDNKIYIMEAQNISCIQPIRK